MSDVRTELVEAGREFKAANEARAAAKAKLAASLEAAQGEVGVREMARLAEVSTVTVYRLLGKDVKT